MTWTFTTAAATTLTTAVFIERDSTTEGNWIGTYGTEGYDIANSGSSIPSNVTVTAGTDYPLYVAKPLNQDAGARGSSQWKDADRLLLVLRRKLYVRRERKLGLVRPRAVSARL